MSPTPSRSTPLANILLYLSALLMLLLQAVPALADPIKPEEAFAFSARMLSPDAVEIRYDIRQGYYLYRSKLRFSAEPDGVTLDITQLPTGLSHQDDFFGKQEVYRNTLVATLPVKLPEGVSRFRLMTESQGCWDGGICYPPIEQSVELDLDAPPQNAGGDFFQNLLSGGKNRAQSSHTSSSAVSPPSLSLPAQPAAASSGDESGHIAALLRDASLWLILVSFFGFGLLLAFTPCTFPMIPILSGIIVGQGPHISRKRTLLLSGIYVLGMAMTYAAAGIAAGLSGTLLSAALQNVWVLGAFALLLVVLSLSMFGFYELQLPSALQSRLTATSNNLRGGQLGGVAMMGVLSALIVGPCVAAPLAGALLYIAQTKDAVLGGTALFVMALGMGVPLILVGIATRSILPRVGPWMEGVKKAFGIILLALAVWLLTPVVPALLVMLAWAALLVFSGVFLRAFDSLPPRSGGWARFWKGTGIIMLLYGAAILLGALAGSRDPVQPLAVFQRAVAPSTQPVFERIASVAELESRLKTTRQPVLLDFYADWCVSCKEMEQFTFSNPEVSARMGKMLLLKADVTANTADDKALLQRFSLFGPPGIIFFDAKGQELSTPRVVGFMRSEPFGQLLDRVLQAPPP